MRTYNGTQDLDLHTLEALYKMMLDSGRDKDWLGFLIANKKRLPLVEPKCCEGGPQWGHAWGCHKSP